MRMTVDEALRHPYVKKFVNEAEETVLTEMITIPMDTIKYYREILYLEIMKKKKESRK
jgi:mitogen-activated protein kinase 15